MMIVLCFVFSGCENKQNKETYERAKKYISGDERDRAISELERLGDYKDSEKLLEEQKKLKKEELKRIEIEKNHVIKVLNVYGEEYNWGDYIDANKYKNMLHDNMEYKTDVIKDVVLIEAYLDIEALSYQRIKIKESYKNLSEGTKAEKEFAKEHKNEVLEILSNLSSALNGSVVDKSGYIDIYKESKEKIREDLIFKAGKMFDINDADLGFADSNESKERKELEIGMSKREVREAWGKPEKINETKGSYGIHEQWVYSRDRYVYLENGIVTSIQQSR